MRNKILKITIIAIFILITIFLPKTLATDMPENETDNTISQNTPSGEDGNNTNISNTTDNETNTSTQDPIENETPVNNSNNNNSSNGSTNSNSNNDRNTGNSNNGNNSGTTTQINRESSNANLSNLGIRPNDFSGFTPNTTTYNVIVPEDVEEVEVYAQAQDVGAVIEGTGNIELDYGENIAEVIVTAEDGTTKTYTIYITRQGEENQAEETQISNNEGLATLRISDVTMEPDFVTDVYEYKVRYIGEATQLNIELTPTNEEYITEIIGNTDLQEGENLITILVTDEEENNVATYQLIVNKSLVDYEAIAREEQEQRTRTIMLIVAGIIGVIIIVVITIIIIKKKKSKSDVEQYTVPYSGMNENDYISDDNDDNEYQKSKDNERNKEESNDLISNQDEERRKMKEKLRRELYSNYTTQEDEQENDNDIEKTSKKHKAQRYK